MTIKRITIFSLLALATASVTFAAPAKTTKAAAKPVQKGPGHTVLSAFVPNSYIVELNGDAVVPALNKAAGMKAFKAHDQKLVTQNRARVANEQRSMRSMIEAKGAKVTGSVDVVMNAMFVHYKGTKQELAALPGVKQVYGVRKMKRTLDRAVINYQVTDVWAALGGQPNAGAGMKIGILDEGIDMTSAAFADAGFQAPNGYPIADSSADRALLNNKVIVGRSYATMVCSDPGVQSCEGPNNTDIDPTIDDHSGHGTATASVAAGVSSSCDEAIAESNGGICLFTNPIAGAAPGAYLGVYRIWDTAADTTTDPVIIQALNDAVADGMDVISMSFGSVYASRFDQDPEYIPVLNAYQAGVLVVCSAGNSGPYFTSIASPATYPVAIAAGAASNDRSFGPGMWGPYIDTNYTIDSADGAAPGTPVVGPVVDAGTLNNNILGCNAFPDGSLNGAVVFIERGTCSFTIKLNNAQAAGASAAIIYDTQANSDACYNAGYPSGLYCAPTMTVAPATLPAQSVDYYTAAYIIAQASVTPFNIVIGFTDTFTVVKNLLTNFSSAGPNVDLSIKPDVVAIGENVAMATQEVFYAGDDYGSSGDLYDPSGYTVADGTSFAAPFTAGVAAMIKGARPGLTTDQYRSLIVNATKGMLDPNGYLYSAQQVGGGLLNALNAYNSPVTALPTSLGLGTSGSNPNITQSITLSNISSNTDTFTLSTASSDGILQPVLPGTVQIGAGQSQSVSITFAGSGLNPGAYQGAIVATSNNTGAQINIPYWLDVSSNTAVGLYSLCEASQFCLTDWVRGATYLGAFDFRLTDAAGAPITGVTPTVTVVSGGGSIVAVNSADAPNANVTIGDPTGNFAGTYTFQDIPGLWTVDVTLGNATGANVFQVSAGNVTQTFTVYGCSAIYIEIQGYCP